MDICSGRVLATNMTKTTLLRGVKGVGISDVVINLTNTTLQFNHNYTITLEMGNSSTLVLGNLSTLSSTYGHIIIADKDNNLINIFCSNKINYSIHVLEMLPSNDTS